MFAEIVSSYYVKRGKYNFEISVRLKIWVQREFWFFSFSYIFCQVIGAKQAPLRKQLSLNKYKAFPAITHQQGLSKGMGQGKGRRAKGKGKVIELSGEMAAISKLASRLPTASGSGAASEHGSGARGTCGQFFYFFDILNFS